MVRFSLSRTRYSAQRCAQNFSLRPGHSSWQLISSRMRSIRCTHDDASGPAAGTPETSSPGTASSTGSDISQFKWLFNFRPATEPGRLLPNAEDGTEVTLTGFLGKRRDKSSSLAFCDLDTYYKPNVQIVSQVVDNEEDATTSVATHAGFRSIPSYSPVVVSGILVPRPRRLGDAQLFGDNEGTESKYAMDNLWDLKLRTIRPLNKFPKDIIVSKGQNWPAKQRHLAMRFDRELRDRIRFRDFLTGHARELLRIEQYEEVETPMLFKSTPEGAREFLVPTRRAGYAYALPQSPQQYKQLLMASGFRQYFQFARCFRDEDLRVDRQPEFTQLDIEKSFATGADVMRDVELLVHALFRRLYKKYGIKYINGRAHPVRVRANAEELKEAKAAMKDKSRETPSDGLHPWPWTGKFPVITYEQAMTLYGSDKPDLRFDSQFLRIDDIVPPSFVSMITKLENPVVEAAQFRLDGTVEENRAFIQKFMDDMPKTPLKLSGDATPGIFIFDESKPLNGLSAFGHEAAEKLAAHETKRWKKLQNGDLIVVHARKDVPFRGEGWSDLGKLRRAIHQEAMDKKIITPNYPWGFCWITQFPLFTPNDAESIAAGEGQGGKAGFSSTHHPFTAPYGPDDFDLLATNPLEAKADHYDLICQGVEVGGGSRRIHVAEMQEYVMRDVLQMTDAGVGQFAHLLEALRAGCPPHAGFAFGWDRFVSILAGVDSVRDVIAFPKSMSGEDKLVNSPSKMTAEQLEAYHLMLAKNSKPDTETKATPTFEPVSAAPEFEPSPSEIPVPGDEPLPSSSSAEVDVENDDVSANDNIVESVEPLENTPAEDSTAETVEPSESENNSGESVNPSENTPAKNDNVAEDTAESINKPESENTPAENDNTTEKSNDRTSV